MTAYARVVAAHVPAELDARTGDRLGAGAGREAAEAAALAGVDQRTDLLVQVAGGRRVDEVDHAGGDDVAAGPQGAAHGLAAPRLADELRELAGDRVGAVVELLGLSTASSAEGNTSAAVSGTGSSTRDSGSDPAAGSAGSARAGSAPCPAPPKTR
jgi:hypothetical protein